MKPFYITTAIDYANGSPHLGHAYEKVLTDVICRVRKMCGDEVYFLTGLDEHGQKVQQSAESQGISPQVFCNGVAEEFQGLCKKLSISNNDYIRTTEDRHKEFVRKIQQDLFDKGEIYKADYQGFYSARQEQFLQEKDRDENGGWPEIYGEVVEITETNYFFKLSQYQDWLIEFLQENPDFIYPKFRQKQVLEFLKEPLNDLCISRPKERLTWGITLPFDDEYVTYVWFDALINYVTGSGYVDNPESSHWPADYHVIGKDILVPAHSIYWPIMLKAAGIPLPKGLLVHGFWTSEGKKMSKSTGNVVDAMALADKYGVDTFRYFVMRDMSVGQDSDFKMERFNQRYKSELANDLGNLVSRIQNMVTRYADGVIPEATVEEDAEKELKAVWNDNSVNIREHYEGFEIHTALEETFTFIRAINRYVEQRAPWKLAKSESAEDQELLKASLANVSESLRLAAISLWPVLPTISETIQVLLGGEPVTSWDHSLEWNYSNCGKSVGEKIILFPRIEE